MMRTFFIFTMLSLMAFYVSGQNMGRAIYEGNTTGIVVYGDDPQTDEVEGLALGESFYISVYNSGLKASNKLKVSHWDQGDEFFASKKISITGFEATENDPDQDFENLAINLYPNPSAGQLVVSLCSPEAQEVSIAAYSLNGQCVYEQKKICVEKGMQELHLDLSILNTGIYTIRVKTNTECKQEKFVIVK